MAPVTLDRFMPRPVLARCFLRTALYCLLTTSAVGAPQVQLGVSVEPSRRQSMDRIDHAIWSDLTQAYVDEQGNVAYGRWKDSPADVDRLDAYLALLSTADPQADATLAARLAFWINAYNAITVRGILREYPTTSIRNHTARFLGYNIWKDLLLWVGDRTYSLDQIEHEILRKMDEPRIHFAIVCASKSCPRLRNEAYTPEKLEQQLTSNARHFFAQPKNLRFDAENATLHLSSILDWFGEDFGRDRRERLRAIAPYVSDAKAREAAAAGEAAVEFLPYDWQLNDRP